MVPYVAYSPDLASDDYHLPTSLTDRTFWDSEEVKKCMDDYFASKSNSLFKEGPSSLTTKRRKVIASNGDYFTDD